MIDDRVRIFALIVVLASLCACGGPGYVRNTLPDTVTLAPSSADAETVLLVAVDGLRADELRKYLRSLRRESHEPRWRSGISMLQRVGKRIVRAQNAEASIATGRGAIATLLTGYTAQVHGQPASAWIPSPSHGGVHTQLAMGGIVAAYDDALGVQQMFLGKLPVPTLIEALPAVRSAAVFLPFTVEQPALTFRPTRAQDHAAWLDDRTRESAAPLVDRTARDIAVDLLQSPEPPNLLLIGMQGMHAATDQQTALRAIDGHLARLVSATRRAHPDRLQRLHLVLIGTSPTTPLTRHPRAFDGDAVRARLTELLPSCAVNFGPEQLRVVAAGRTARLYIAPTKANRVCLHDAMRAARLHASAWLDAAAWRADGRTRIFVAERAEDDLGAIRTRRLIERMQIAAGGPLGDALLFAAPTITFGPTGREAEGGVQPAAIDAPLLLVSAAISDATADQIASAPIELTDIAPTLVHLLGGAWPEDDIQVRRRSPLLTWRDGQWAFVPAARLELPLADQEARVAAAPALQPVDFGAPVIECRQTMRGDLMQLRARVAHPEGIAWVGLHWDSRYAVDQRRTESALVAVFPKDPQPAPQIQRAGAAKPLPVVELEEFLSPVEQALRALRRAGPVGPRTSRKALAARFADIPFTIPPRDAVLSLIACDAFNRCQSTPLISDRDFDTLAKSCK